jgi:hypothetical protein
MGTKTNRSSSAKIKSSGQGGDQRAISHSDIVQ